MTQRTAAVLKQLVSVAREQLDVTRVVHKVQHVVKHKVVVHLVASAALMVVAVRTVKLVADSSVAAWLQHVVDHVHAVRETVARTGLVVVSLVKSAALISAVLPTQCVVIESMFTGAVWEATLSAVTMESAVPPGLVAVASISAASLTYLMTSSYRTGLTRL